MVGRQHGSVLESMFTPDEVWHHGAVRGVAKLYPRAERMLPCGAQVEAGASPNCSSLAILMMLVASSKVPGRFSKATYDGP